MKYSISVLQNPKMQTGFKWLETKIQLKPYRPFGSSKDADVMPIFTVKVRFSLISNKKIYTVIPRYPNYAISEDGTSVLKLANFEEANIRLNKELGYLRVSLQDSSYLGKVKSKSPSVHKLVAMAWCENDDYVIKNVIDHKDKNKLNNHKNNLRWVTNGENQGIAKSMILNNYVAIDLVSGITVAKSSMNHLLASIGLARGSVSLKSLPAYKPDLPNRLWYFTTKDDKDIPPLENAKPSSGIIVKNIETGEVEFFNTIPLFLYRHGGTKKELEGAVVGTTQYSTRDNAFLEILLNRLYEGPKMFKATNIITGKKCSKATLTEIANITKITVGGLRGGLYRNRGCYSVNEWLVSCGTCDDCTYRKTYKVAFEIVYDDKVVKANSLREVSRITGRDRKTITKYIKSKRFMVASGDVLVKIKKVKVK